MTTLSCIKNEVKLPEGFLTEDELVPILVDIHIVEGARSGILVLGDTNTLPDYYAKIYQKHNVTPEDFKTNFHWYSLHPQELKNVYEKVIVELSKKEEAVAQEEKNRNAPVDSVKTKK